MTVFESCFYDGTVMHRRLRPRRHKLRYRVYSALLDLDELAALDRTIIGFGYNRAAPMSFHDSDHGPGLDQPLKPWIEDQLRQAGFAPDGGPIRILCYPRVFGYVFNPISVYFCYRRSGELLAVVHEVNNTFHQRHSYVMAADDSRDGVIAQQCAKKMYVSPFIALDMTYNFKIKPPTETVSIAISDSDREGTVLHASFHGERRALTRTSALAYLFRFPFLTIKVMVGIHWEALKLWLKGIPLVTRPAPPPHPVSLIKSS